MNSAINPKIMQELPLIRAKVGGLEAIGGTGPDVGPGTYDVGHANSYNESRAPFNSTAVRPPLSLADPRIPGPGAYAVDPGEDVRRGIASIPFVSGSTRFPPDAVDSVPGPGTYNAHRLGATKKSARAHRFASGRDRFVAPNENGPSTGPGYYNPNYFAADRKNPKASQFSRYSSRDGKATSETPGPGSYDIGHKPRDLYASKPSSMFATASNRSAPTDSGNPGPGAYNIPSFLQKAPSKYAETFSGFGSTAGRFTAQYAGDYPGPGAYTGEIAPRRARPQPSHGTAAFLSDSNRFGGQAHITPGPGAYDGRPLPSHLSYSAETPFMSTVPRFGPSSTHPRPLPFDDETFEQTDPRLLPPSKHVYRRQFVDRDIAPATAKTEQYPNRGVYYPVYDSSKPTADARSLFGGAPRLASAPRKDGPGPGAYGVPEGARGTRQTQSSWARDPRFHTRHSKREGEPTGHTYYESTFFTKSHNVTIGSDTMWTDAH